MLFRSDPKKAKILRKKLAPFFSPNSINKIINKIEYTTDKTIDTWIEKYSDKIIPLNRELINYTYDSVSNCLFSGFMHSKLFDEKKFHENFRKLLLKKAKFNFFDLFGFEKISLYYDLMYYSKYEGDIENSILSLMNERKKMLEDNDYIPDLLTEIMSPDNKLSKYEMSSNIFGFLVTGHETTAQTLSWTLFLLSQSSEWYELAKKESINTNINNYFNYEQELPIITAVLKEAMRLYPVIPIMARISTENDKIKNLNIEKNTKIIVAPWVLHKHFDFWKNPFSFNPERFLPENNKNIVKNTYIPFGLGPRT